MNREEAGRGLLMEQKIQRPRIWWSEAKHVMFGLGAMKDPEAC